MFCCCEIDNHKWFYQGKAFFLLLKKNTCFQKKHMTTKISLKISDEEWEAFKRTIDASKSINDHIVELIRNHTIKK